MDLAGVELVKGVRYMSRIETAVSWKNLLKVSYEFAIVPSYRKIELTDGNENVTHSWQEPVETLPLPLLADGEEYDGYDLLGRAFFCSSKPISVAVQNAASNDASQYMVDGKFVPGFKLNYTYEGVDYVNDRPARHFRIVIIKNGTVDTAVDLWDTQDGQTPLALAFETALTGKVYVKIQEIRSLDESSPEVQPAALTPPSEAFCSDDEEFTPRLTSSYDVVGGTGTSYYQLVSDAEPATDLLSPTERRRVMERSLERESVWAGLDHVNGTGEWPQWALDVYGGVRPASSSAERRVSGCLALQLRFPFDSELNLALKHLSAVLPKELKEIPYIEFAEVWVEWVIVINPLGMIVNAVNFAISIGRAIGDTIYTNVIAPIIDDVEDALDGVVDGAKDFIDDVGDAFGFRRSLGVLDSVSKKMPGITVFRETFKAVTPDDPVYIRLPPTLAAAP
ncbi:hypothetical protein GPECTOR_84g320 [Gonium pectorale]|uniref:Uncharacterized protein n=1 Tax=Gonium pectorale TaxID=33097 RepID=A0A150G1E4_GONPE|nr:hypothetical protein GPECTOR_84g320 [Gonium pectorale]|eukprot:KXZ43644.1 hypothetical protein GPECTOR_84g320 [Gonium pectorale]